MATTDMGPPKPRTLPRLSMLGCPFYLVKAVLPQRNLQSYVVIDCNGNSLSYKDGSLPSLPCSGLYRQCQVV